MNNDQLIEKAEAKAKELYPLEAVSIKDHTGRIKTIEQQEAFVACAKWMAGESAPQPVRDSVQNPDRETTRPYAGNPPYGEHSFKCNFCQQWLDMRDLGQVLEHEHEDLKLDQPIKGQPAPMEQIPRTGRIHYGGHRQHTVHYVIPNDDTKELIKVSEASRKIAVDRQAERQRQMKKEGYEGPFGLPHHCFTHGQSVSFTVDEAGEAVIIF